MTKIEMEKKIKDLERRNKFLLLQLKIISDCVKNPNYENIVETLGPIMSRSDSGTIKGNVHYIEVFDNEYNYFEPEINIDDYIF